MRGVFTCYRVCRNESYPHGSFVHPEGSLSPPAGLFAEVDVCPTGALTPPQWIGRGVFVPSQRPYDHPSGTGVMGRGTDEIKTNDVTGRLRQGDAGWWSKWEDPEQEPISGYRKSGHGPR